jgi:hypothetical protein
MGGFYGGPFATGAKDPDPDFGESHEAEIATSIPPVHGFRAHNAPLGIVFLQRGLSAELPRGTALVALHGSWNRTRKDGYSVVALRFLPDGEIEEQPFVWGFLAEDDVVGRPVDVAEDAEGAVYVSDDYAGAVYRIAAGAQGAPAAPGGRAAAGGGDPLAGISESERAAASARGAALYEANACYRCHDAARAEPGTVPVAIAKLRERYDVPALVSFLATPTPPMPAFPLADAERRDLAIHLLATAR